MELLGTILLRNPIKPMQQFHFIEVEPQTGNEKDIIFELNLN